MVIGNSFLLTQGKMKKETQGELISKTKKGCSVLWGSLF